MTASAFIVLTLLVSGAGCAVYFTASRMAAKRESRRLSRAIATADQINRSVGQIPPHMLPREVRRALVLILNQQIKVLTEIRPDHPHGWYLENRLRRLNQLPTGFDAKRIRCRAERKRIGQALEHVSELVRDQGGAAGMKEKEVDIAVAGAAFAHRQIAVETVRQAVKDAEHIRAYPQALSLAYQARALCSRLPPRSGKALSDSVAADVARLEAVTRQAVRS